MTDVILISFGVVAGALAALFAALILLRAFRARAEALAEANRRFQATFEQAAVGVAHLDPSGRWIRINKRFCEIAGYPHDELMAMSVDDVTHPLDRPTDTALRGEMMAGNLEYSRIEKRYVRKDGSVIWVNATRSAVRGADGRPEFFVAVVEEITSRKEAETRLIVGAAQYRAIFDSAVEAMAVIDARGVIQSVNPSVERIFGYAPEQMIGQNISKLMPASIAQHHDGYLDRYCVTGEKAIIGIGREVLGQRSDGSLFPLDLSVAEWEQDGEPFFTGVMRDVSARKDAEAALLAGEAQYRAIFDSAVEAMAVIDSNGIVQSVNPAVERIFGYPPAEIVGHNIKQLMPEPIAGEHDDYLRSYRKTGKRAIIGIGREVMGMRKDGSLFPLDLSVAEWKREGQSFFTGVMRDVSARKDAEAALRGTEENLRQLQNDFAHLARVNDLGEMAAAIAHEINQPLTAIVNYLNHGLFLGEDAYSEDAFVETQSLMSSASEQALRAGDIVRRLREFIGHANGSRNVERLEKIVDSATELALIDARTSGIAVERVKGAGDAEIQADAVQIEQVLVNLLRNALEAMNSIPHEVGAAKVEIGTAELPRNQIEIVVADNGPGIPADIRDRLFDPFVTTKSKGMGMGLSVCRRIVEAHGGTIAVESTPGEGATFRVRLPRFRSDRA